jgi:hypothetical protein
MKKVNAVLLALIAAAAIVVTSRETFAQHKHASEMSEMMQSPHHKLMMAYMRSMSEFARTLYDEAVKAVPLDLEFARATVAELRHNFDAAESLHQRHMGMMSVEMQSKMKTMMEKMDKNRTMVKDQLTALESDVHTDKPNSKQVAAHANALLTHLAMMSKMHVGSAEAQQQTTAPSGNMKGMEGMNKRGDRVMGFDHDKTTHHFRLLPDGGVIEVEANDAKDTANRDKIRMHLRHIASMFANGNFEAPMMIHSQTPPGVPVMKSLKAEIKYQFEETERGGLVRITTSNAKGLAAVYEFLRFQIKEHQTGDSGQVEKQ